MLLLAYGREGLLVELGSLAEVDAVRDAVVRAALPGVVDVVPAARTVLVTVDDAARLPSVRSLVTGLDPSAAPAPAPEGDVVDLPVRYDGEDLELVADDAGLTPDEVVAMHTGAGFTVAFGGFAPGFAYLTGLPEPLRQPRLSSPRTRIPTGSVGVAGEFSGVYPRASPGGWRLLGRLADDAPTLFDPARERPALLTPGTQVRFHSVS